MRPLNPTASRTGFFFLTHNSSLCFFNGGKRSSQHSFPRSQHITLAALRVSFVDRTPYFICWSNSVFYSLAELRILFAGRTPYFIRWPNSVFYSLVELCILFETHTLRSPSFYRRCFIFAESRTQFYFYRISLNPNPNFVRVTQNNTVVQRRDISSTVLKIKSPLSRPLQHGVKL